MASAALLILLRWIAVAAIAATLLVPMAMPGMGLGTIHAAIFLAGGASLLIGARFSSFPFAVLAPDPMLLAFAIAAAGSLAAAMGQTGFHVLVALGLGALASLVLSRRHFHRILDLVPLPLLAGLMGAEALTGIGAGLALAIGAPLETRHFLRQDVMLVVLATLVAGAVLGRILARGAPKWLALPVLAALGVAASRILPVTSPPMDGAAFALLPMAASPPDWAGLVAALPTVVAVAVLVPLMIRVAVRDLEGQAGFDADPPREFLVGGGASLGSALLALAPASLSPELSLSFAPLGARARNLLTGLALAGMAAGLLATLLLPGIPGAVPGALLVAGGLMLLETWILRTGLRGNGIERLALFGILATILIFGPAYGLVIGNAAGAAAFALAYSRARPVRARYEGDVALSNVDRSPPEMALLRAEPQSRIVLAVQGFLFFGTADRLLGDVRAEMARAGGALRFLVLDLGDVAGADSSAVMSFGHMVEDVRAAGITLCLAQMSDELARRLLPGGLPESGVLRFASLDEALEHAETARLAEAMVATTGGRQFSALLAEEEGAGIAARILAWFRPVEFAAGAALMRQGDRSDELQFLETGGASVFVALPQGGQIRVRRFGAGTMIGEMSFHLGTPRTASVIADAPSTCLGLDRAALRRMEAEDPGAALGFHDFLARRLCRRILDKDQVIANLMIVSRR